MSRSSSRPPRQTWRRLIISGAAVVTTVVVGGALPAASEPTPPVVRAPGPDAGGAPATTPVINIAGPTLDIVAPILDIEVSSSDTKKEARLEEAPKKTKVTLDSTIAFGKDSAKLRPSAGKRLSEVAAILEKKGPGRVAVVGYTDDLGSAAHGQKLSEQRAKAVSTVLKRTLPASDFRFTVAGKGEADPAVPNDSEANRKINRRVEITYTQG